MKSGIIPNARVYALWYARSCGLLEVLPDFPASTANHHQLVTIINTIFSVAVVGGFLLLIDKSPHLSRDRQGSPCSGPASICSLISPQNLLFTPILVLSDYCHDPPSRIPSHPNFQRGISLPTPGFMRKNEVFQLLQGPCA